MMTDHLSSVTSDKSQKATKKREQKKDVKNKNASIRDEIAPTKFLEKP